ncbi:phage major capsid protein [Desulfosporosinus sp.]|uniref:phage major capsid protein n=1 Tax=Desulfosporosinus sp. TaxID=157907 RepID=UPI0025BEE9CC|nr:phage major capsid protein [Desulfosporosinus sp.]
MLAAKEARKAELTTRSNASTDVAEVRSIGLEMDTLNSEIAELRGLLDEIPDEPTPPAADPEFRGEPKPGTTGEQRSMPVGRFNVLATYGTEGGQPQEKRSVDQYDTHEYRSAFMDYVQRGIKSDVLEFRADATTGTGDIGTVIPTTILNNIIEKMKDYGTIWSKINKTSILGGVEQPTSALKPVATWTTAGTVSDKQKKTTGSISFSYHKLQCRVAVELVAGTVALPAFESAISDNIYEAMIVALEQAIISGPGIGQPLGIAKDPDIPAAQIVTVAAADLGEYNTWTTLLAKLPRSYRNGAVIIMNDADWNKYIVGMVDVNGQPVARTTYGLDGTQVERFLGKEVIPVEEYLPSIDDALMGDVIGIVCKLKSYMVNTNMQMTFKRYFNEDTDEWISKSTMIADGKLSDKNGALLIKKA